MLDLKYLRTNWDKVKHIAELRGESVDIDELKQLDHQRRQLVKACDTKRAELNHLTREIGKLKREGKNDPKLIEAARQLSAEISHLEERLRSIEAKFMHLLLWIPNIVHASVPLDEPKILREVGKSLEHKFDGLDHFTFAEQLGMVDFVRGAKVAGSNFPLYIGWGARLERALINYMLDFHVKRGFKEVFTPFVANRQSMIGTGQLPKLEDDMYHIEREDFFLNPTAEVTVANLHREEILPEEKLPLRYVAYTACFRREAGSYGRGTRGLKRVHQFNKVELFSFAHPEHSYEELEFLLNEAEEVIKSLGLRYRVVLLPIHELGFAAAKTYDIEVWAPISKEWLEVSSVSNCEAFQARRAKIKFRTKHRTDYVHTLNASGVATPRTFIAILETYQNPDGSLTVPEVLRPYMDGKKRIP